MRVAAPGVVAVHLQLQVHPAVAPGRAQFVGRDGNGRKGRGGLGLQKAEAAFRFARAEAAQAPVHFLSKRTDLYLVAMRDSIRTQTLPAPPRALDAQGTSFALGVRHRF